MLRYTEFGLSHLEVPGERALCIYLSGCANRCENCHCPELQLPDNGILLRPNIRNIVDLYRSQASCVCFLGEGSNSDQDRAELVYCAKYARSTGLKTCLYSGRDTEIEAWMDVFDYIKLGSYREEFGPLSLPMTNQRMYQRADVGDVGYIDITAQFWHSG